jgi:tmRNA-binding protein
LSLAKGKKLYDKREVIKQRDIQRQNEKDWWVINWIRRLG